MATKDTVVQELVVNTLTQAQFDAAKKAGTLSPYELYGTPDTSVRLPVLTPMWFDHLANDVSWLRADTFSWQSGDVYVAAYEHLLADFEGTAVETETIGDITIAFYRAEDGHKICLLDQESNIVALYESTGVAWYYLLDTENKQFKLPRSKHNKYASTLPVVGNGMNIGLTDGSTNYGFGYKASDQSLKGLSGFYGKNVGTSGGLGGVASAASSGNSWGVTKDATKSGIIATQEQDADQYKYLYFYVGNFTQDAVEQTAGINAELFNGKADRNLLNTTDNVDIVIESQLPTADNGYTWYRKYKSGWVEQGGMSSSQTVTMPIEMAGTSYSIQLTGTCDSTKNNVVIHGFRNRTTTSFVTQGNVVNNNGESAASNTSTKFWQVSGMAA